MSAVSRSAHRQIRSSCSKIFTHRSWRRHCSPPVSTVISTSLFTRPFSSAANPNSPFDAITLRLLRSEIEYQLEYSPPHKPATSFKSFTVEDRPGQQWISLRGRFQDTEEIRIEATMSAGGVYFPRFGVSSDGEYYDGDDLHLHISVLVEISKGDGSGNLEFLCSAWPTYFLVLKAYVVKGDRMLARPFMGPEFGELSREIRTKFYEFLARRGIDKELSVFLHEFMRNKDKCELVRWLSAVKSFVER